MRGMTPDRHESPTLEAMPDYTRPGSLRRNARLQVFGFDGLAHPS